MERDNGHMREKDKIILMVITISKMFPCHVKRTSQIWQEEKLQRNKDPNQNGDKIYKHKIIQKYLI